MNMKNIIEEMKKVFKDVPYGIEHTMRVLKNAEQIMDGQEIEAEKKELISVVAILHDIGALEAQRKYGSMEGRYQEMEGPGIAREILERVGYHPQKIERVCYIISNHHTPSKIDGIDFQIQWEADLLENLTVMDKESEKVKIKQTIDENFKTATGKKIAYDRFVIS